MLHERKSGPQESYPQGPQHIPFPKISTFPMSCQASWKFLLHTEDVSHAQSITYTERRSSSSSG